MDTHLLAGLALSAAIGLSLGLIGGGGSVITVPVLVYVIGVEAREAVGMSLAVVGVTSLIGAYLHHRRGAVSLRSSALFGGAGIFGAYFGSRVTYMVTPAALLLSFAALMLTTAALMLAQQRRARKRAAAAVGVAARRPGAAKAAGAGLVVGLLTGFLGVGGGFLVVPALMLFAGLPMKEAIGSSLLVIAINCAAGLVGHLQRGGFDTGLTLLVTALAAAGTLAGTALSHRMSPARLKTGFAVFTIAVAFFLIAKNYSALSP